MTPRCKLHVERCQSLNLWLRLFEQDLRLHTSLNGAVRHCARDWNLAKSTSCWSSAVTGPPRNEPFPFLCSYAYAILKRSLISSAVPLNNTIAGHPFSVPEHHAFAYLYLDLGGASLCPSSCLCYGYVVSSDRLSSVFVIYALDFGQSSNDFSLAGNGIAVAAAL